MRRINNKMRYGMCFAVAVTLVFAFSCVVSAFGAGAPYWSENPLYLEAGESENVVLKLQNMVGDEDVTLRAEVTRGGEVVSLTDSNLDYLVPSKTKDVPVNLRIEVPADAEEGVFYPVSVSFTQVAEEEGRMVRFQGAIIKTFDVIVGAEPVVEAAAGPEAEEVGYSWVWWVVLVVVVIVLIYIIARKKK